MINNNEDIQNYSNQNKIYVPNSMVNQNYTYKINGDIITIITNNNCYTNYNTTYCDCRQYNYKVDLLTENYSCSTNNNNQTIAYTSITNDINYSEIARERFIQDKFTIITMIAVGLIFAIFLTKERKSY